jgi:phosphoribosylaminoimidazole-succinocarboxamide synthase
MLTMNDASVISNSISRTAFQFPSLTSVYYGKVRDVYIIADNFMVSIVTDRVSAFDVIMPRPIPYKGQVLNLIAKHFMEATRDICPNWVFTVPDPNVTVGILCKPYKVEMVVRGYLTGHAWREYQAGKRTICGVSMPEGMRENQKFPEPLITPTTKSDHGHDLDISREEILSSALVPEDAYLQMERYALMLFQRGQQMALDKGLLLVDTKYEFGESSGRVFLIDEIHTPDSSRYFYSEGYEERLREGKPQKQLSKEFLRQWLLENGFSGQEGQQPPEFSDEWCMEISERYIELYEKITGRTFERVEYSGVNERIERNVLNCLTSLLSGI